MQIPVSAVCVSDGAEWSLVGPTFHSTLNRSETDSWIFMNLGLHGEGCYRYSTNDFVQT